MRAMGLDLGKKTIGVAVSDPSGLTAQPVTTIRRTTLNRDIDALLALVEEYEAGVIVVGLPVNMDGSLGWRSRETLKFVDFLKAKTGAEVVTWDERLSTVAVTRVLIEGGASRSRRKAVVDKMAAAYILQGYLDSRKAL
ncbi:MAG: Holliday junction resolvase RuvX [Thermodesulfobacteriota bacterium]